MSRVQLQTIYSMKSIPTDSSVLRGHLRCQAALPCTLFQALSAKPKCYVGGLSVWGSGVARLVCASLVASYPLLVNFIRIVSPSLVICISLQQMDHISDCRRIADLSRFNRGSPSGWPDAFLHFLLLWSGSSFTVESGPSIRRVSLSAHATMKQLYSLVHQRR